MASKLKIHDHHRSTISIGCLKNYIWYMSIIFNMNNVTDITKNKTRIYTNDQLFKIALIIRL